MCRRGFTPRSERARFIGIAAQSPRLFAYAVNAKNDAQLGRMAWEKLIGETLAGGVPEIVVSRRVESAGALEPRHDPVFL